MRKLVMVLGVAVGLALGVGIALSPTASANNGPHGNYDLTTNKCAACHRAHTAQGEDLLIKADVYELCVSCHGGTVQTDVINGQRSGDQARLNGGGFVAMPWNLNAAGTPTTPVSKPAQSTHTVLGLPVNGTPSTGLGTAWGSGSSGSGVSGTLECTSCHNPHGSVNYRILRDEDNGYPYGPSNWGSHRWVPNDAGLENWRSYQVVATADDGFNYAETAVDGTSKRIKGHYTTGMITREDLGHGVVDLIWANGTPWAGPTPNNGVPGMSGFCGTCHRQYLTKTESAAEPSDTGTAYFWNGTQDIGDGSGDIARFRHAVYRSYGGSPDQVLRFGSVSQGYATPVGGGTPYPITPTDQVNNPIFQGFTCLTCHYAHGTAAVATGYAAGVAPTNDSALLYYDNRGVCRSCHQKSK